MTVEKNEAGLYQAEIDGSMYEFQKWGAEEATATLLKMTKIAGKPLGMAVAAIFDGDPREKKLKKQVPPDMIAQIFDAFSESMDEGVCMTLIKKFTSGGKVFCEGAPVKSFDQHYADKLLHMFNVLRAALEVQYGNFFAGLLGGVGLNRQPSSKMKTGPANREA